jgi:hypothetical protein
LTTIQYFGKWLLWDGIFSKPLTREQAAARHAAGKPYIALRTLDDGEKQVIDLAGEWVSVYFLDEHNRSCLEYDFRKVQPERVFLDTVRYKEYADETNKPSRVSTLRYREDGSVLVIRWYADETVEDKEEHTDPASNWDLYPEFGQYDGVCRFDRERE